MRWARVWALGISLAGATIVAAAEPPAYPAAEAAHHVGETAVVTGLVSGVRTMNSGMVLVNIGGRYPHQALTVMVRPEHADAVGDLSGLTGKNVSVRGKIILYRGKPEIEVADKDQIRTAEPSGH